jgi:hypothetical protein
MGVGKEFLCLTSERLRDERGWICVTSVFFIYGRADEVRQYVTRTRPTFNRCKIIQSCQTPSVTFAFIANRKSLCSKSKVMETDLGLIQKTDRIRRLPLLLFYCTVHV